MKSKHKKRTRKKTSKNWCNTECAVCFFKWIKYSTDNGITRWDKWNYSHIQLKRFFSSFRKSYGELKFKVRFECEANMQLYRERFIAFLLRFVDFFFGWNKLFADTFGCKKTNFVFLKIVLNFFLSWANVHVNIWTDQFPLNWLHISVNKTNENNKCWQWQSSAHIIVTNYFSLFFSFLKVPTLCGVDHKAYRIISACFLLCVLCFSRSTNRMWQKRERKYHLRALLLWMGVWAYACKWMNTVQSLGCIVISYTHNM